MTEFFKNIIYNGIQKEWKTGKLFFNYECIAKEINKKENCNVLAVCIETESNNLKIHAALTPFFMFSYNIPFDLIKRFVPIIVD